MNPSDHPGGLGRVYLPDPRDAGYRIAHHPTALATGLETSRTFRSWWTGGAWLNQGHTSTCVGHGWAHWVEDGPVTHPGTVDPMAIYDRAILLDEWSDNDQDPARQWGTSVRAGAEVLRGMGLVSEYRWAFSWEELDYALLEIGPVVVAMDWYEPMFHPDGSGLVQPSGAVVGGHCLKLDARNRRRKLTRAKNSWGREWGHRGFCYFHDDDLKYLLFGANGEACLATEMA